jgi:hypothetical protein
MPAPTLPTNNLLTDPGWLYRAPLGSTLPANTVTGSVFTDAWPAAWLPQGLTDAGSTFTPSITVEAIEAAELFDPIAYRTTGRTASVAFALKNFTATNLAAAMNGATVTTTGSTTTTLTQIDPPQPGSEIRQMLGWESLDNTVRIIWRQVVNSGDLEMAMQKAPANANIPWNAQLEKPSSSQQPFSLYFAGASRAGS